MMVYHGTKKDFSEFKTKEHNNEGYYFTSDPKYAYTFMGYDNDTNDLYKSTNDYLNNPTHGEINPNIVPVYLSTQNPLIISEENVDIIEDIKYWKNIYDTVKSKGYDGVMMEDMSQIFVFNSNQIKSSYGNKGTFDPNKKSIIEKLN